MARTLTSATAQLSLSIAGLFNSPVLIAGWATDDAFSGEPLENAEAVMGVDAKMSVGWVPNPFKLRLVLQADSPSIDLFNAWGVAQQGTKEVYVANGSAYIPATTYKYALTKGVLQNWRPMPELKRIIQPQAFEILFESCIGGPTGN